MRKAIESFFKLKELNTDIRAEITAGLSSWGEMAERLKAVASKAIIPKGIGGSNPPLSAIVDAQANPGRYGLPWAPEIIKV